jgi:hypothetical protein
MGSILNITSQLNTERTYLHPQAVFHKIERGEPIPLGAPGEQKWAVPHAITLVQEDDDDDDRSLPVWSRSSRRHADPRDVG